MALTHKVQSIIVMAEAIGQMGLFQRPAAYEELVKNEIVPVLLAVAEHVDSFNEPLPGGVEEISVAEVLNEFQDKLKASDELIAELKQEITTLKGRMTKMQKSGSGVAA